MADITLKDQDTFMCMAADIQLLIEKYGYEQTLQLVDLAFDIDLVTNAGYKANIGSDFAQKFLDAMRQQAAIESSDQMMDRLNG